MSNYSLIPLSLRVAPQQLERLRRCRALDGVTMQDHIRRSLDLYLDHMDQIYAKRSGLPLAAPITPAAGPAEQVPITGVAPAHPVALPGHKSGAGDFSSRSPDTPADPTPRKPQAVLR